MVEVYVHYFLHIGVCGSGQIFLRQIWINVDASTRQPFMFCSWMFIWLLSIMLGVLLIFKRKKNINSNNYLFINNTFFTKESKNINCNLMTYQYYKKIKLYQQQQLSVPELTIITIEIENINCIWIIYP